MLLTAVADDGAVVDDDVAVVGLFDDVVVVAVVVDVVVVVEVADGVVDEDGVVDITHKHL